MAVPCELRPPKSPRHGTFLPITQAELDRLPAHRSAAWPTARLSHRYRSTMSSGSTVTDASGNGNNAAVVGGATWSDGSLRFGGTDGYVKLPDNAMAGMQALTVSTDVWVDPAQQKPYFLWGMGNTDAAGAGNGYVFSTGDNYRAAIASGNWSTEQGAATSSPLGRGSWRPLSTRSAAARRAVPRRRLSRRTRTSP